MPERIPPQSFLHTLEVFGIRGGRKVWREGAGNDARYYTWDSLHGEVEVFNRRGRHLGALHPVSGKLLKGAIEGRKLEI